MTLSFNCSVFISFFFTRLSGNIINSEREREERKSHLSALNINNYAHACIASFMQTRPDVSKARLVNNITG